MDPWGLRVTQNAYFSFVTHIKQLLKVTFFDISIRLQVLELDFRDIVRWKDGCTDRRGG